MKIKNVVFLLVFSLFSGLAAHVPTVWAPEQATHLCIDCLMAGAHAKAAHEAWQDQSKNQLKSCSCTHTAKITLSATNHTHHQATHATLYDDNMTLECVNGATRLIQAIQNFGGRLSRQVMSSLAGHTTSALALLTTFLLFQCLGRFSASTQFAMLRLRKLIVIAPRA